eukprot:6193362-Pleurochrysis_carterae.AAC.2
MAGIKKIYKCTIMLCSSPEETISTGSRTKCISRLCGFRQSRLSHISRSCQQESQNLQELERVLNAHKLRASAGRRRAWCERARGSRRGDGRKRKATIGQDMKNANMQRWDRVNEFERLCVDARARVNSHADVCVCVCACSCACMVP